MKTWIISTSSLALLFELWSTRKRPFSCISSRPSKAEIIEDGIAIYGKMVLFFLLFFFFLFFFPQREPHQLVHWNPVLEPVIWCRSGCSELFVYLQGCRCPGRGCLGTEFCFLLPQFDFPKLYGKADVALCLSPYFTWLTCSEGSAVKARMSPRPWMGLCPPCMEPSSVKHCGRTGPVLGIWQTAAGEYTVFSKHVLHFWPWRRVQGQLWGGQLRRE